MKCYEPPPPATPDLHAASVLADIANTQAAFHTLQSMLMIASYLFPKQAKLKDGDEFDFIIVGGGTAGCVMANKLVKANYTVLLLEAGDIKPYESFLAGALVYIPKSGLDWEYMAGPNKFTEKCHRSPAMFVPVGKVLGGASSIGFMLASRGINQDYHQWATAVNDSSWEYSNLLPYFKRSEKLQDPKKTNDLTRSCREKNYKEQTGNIIIQSGNGTKIKDILNAFGDMGNEIVHELGGRHSKGYTGAYYTIGNCHRQSTALGYLTPVKRFPNVFMSLKTTVTKIIFDKKKNAIGVKASINGKKEIFLRAKKEVILCAGAIKSPQLLMLSGVGPKKHLEEKKITVISDLPVGENFQDHPMVTVMHKGKKVPDPGPFNFRTYSAHVIKGYKSMERSAVVPDYGTITFIEERRLFNLQYCSLPFDYKSEICERSYKQVFGRQMVYTHVIVLNPKSRGRVMLNTSCPFDAPLINTGHFTNKKDVNNLISYLKDYLGIGNTTFFKEVNGGLIDAIGGKCDMFEYGTDEYWKCYIYCMSTSMWNYGGTCAMGSVVDHKLKVIGVKRLRVADASVMPTIVSGGNYLATIVIAEKASDMIKRDYK